MLVAIVWVLWIGHGALRNDATSWLHMGPSAGNEFWCWLVTTSRSISWRVCTLPRIREAVRRSEMAPGAMPCNVERVVVILWTYVGIETWSLWGRVSVCIRVMTEASPVWVRLRTRRTVSWKAQVGGCALIDELERGAGGRVGVSEVSQGLGLHVRQVRVVLHP